MPLTKILVVGNEATLQTASALDPTQGDQTIIPSDEDHHVGLQAIVAGKHLNNQAGVAIADGLQDDALYLVVHQF